MKKLFKILIISLVALSLFACNSAPKTEETKTASETTESSQKLSIGFVTDEGGIDDKSFNQTSWEGIVKFAEEAGLKVNEDVRYLQSKAETDYIPNLSNFAEEGSSLVVAAGYKFADAILKTAELYPDQKILIIDVDWLDPAKTPNVRQAVFSEHEGSFLVGVAAALKTIAAGKDTVGYITGGEGATMNKFEAGYQAGVWAVSPTLKILRDNADGFANAEKGKTLAAKQYNAGAYVIYHAAGGTGIGVIQEAATRRDAGEDVWVIGVDTNQYELGKYGTEGKSAVLTSMLKGVDIASYNASKDLAEGKFTAGVIEYTLKDGGVGIPASNPNLTEEDIKVIEEYKAKIVSGEIVVPKVHVADADSDLIN